MTPICNATFSDNNSLISHCENVHNVHVQKSNTKGNKKTSHRFF